MTVLTRRNATTVLYVKPIISTRNLSTLIAVDVSIDTAHQTCAVDSIVRNGLVDVYYPSKELNSKAWLRNKVNIGDCQTSKQTHFVRG